MRFDLVDLRLLVQAAEVNSLTRGAEASNISLPAASARVKNLEENIGAVADGPRGLAPWPP